MMGALRLDRESSRGQHSDLPVQIIQSQADRDKYRMGSGPAPELHQDLCAQRRQSEPAAGPDYTKVRRTTAVALSWSQLASAGLSPPVPLSDGKRPPQKPGGHVPVSDESRGAEFHPR